MKKLIGLTDYKLSGGIQAALLRRFTWGRAMDVVKKGGSVVLVGVFLLSAISIQAQDNTVFFSTDDPGVSKSIAEWGFDTAWDNWDNGHRSAIYMGQPQVDVVRASFTGDWALNNGNLSTSAQNALDNRLNIIDSYTDAHTTLYLNNATGTLDPSFDNGDGGVNPSTWAQLIDATMQYCEADGRTVVGVAPFNEPDNATWQGDVTRLGDVCWQIRNAFGTDFNGVDILGANTLNPDFAASWYDTLNSWGYVQEGGTHQLAGTFDNYAAFFQDIVGNGDIAVNDELHNVMEAIVGAEYGMQVGIWWGTAERARGEFVKASDGDRLAYSENRWNWTAASVYRAPSGVVEGFVGESERQALPTTFRFVAKDRPVFYDGHGPQRTYDVTTTGDGTYASAAHKNAERVVNITWGDDVQPAINGRYYLVNRNSLKVMEVAGGSHLDGANIQQNTYNGSTYQQWDVNPMPSASGGDYSYFSMTAVHSGKAADLYNFDYNDGGNINQWSTGTYAGVNQQYFMEYVEDGWFFICNRWSGKYLDVNGGSTADGANIFLWSGNGQYNQQWRLVPVTADPTDFTAPATPIGLSATANPVSVQLNWTANTETDLGGYTVLRSTTSGGPYDIIARGVTANSYTDNSAIQSVSYYYVVRATDQSGNRSANSTQASATPSGGTIEVVQYNFDGNASDATGNGNDAILNGGTSYGAGHTGTGSLVLDGASGYAALPAEIANYDQLTVAAWVYWNGGGAWQRIFDFGNGTDEYLFLTPNSGSGTLRFAIKNGGAEQLVDTSPLAVGQWTHVAVTLGGGTAKLYINGAEVNSSASFTIKPSDITPILNYIGKSQWPDPLFDGSIDDFQVYNYALSAPEIDALANGAPDTTPPASPTGLGATAGDGSVSLDWADNTEPDLASYTVYRSTTSGSGYGVIASGLAVSAYMDNTAANGTTYYYVVTATDTSSNESANSSEVSATPASSGNPTLMHVDAITMTTVSAGRGSKTGRATVTILDGTGSPVSGATVSGTFTGSYNESQSGVTDASGAAVINTAATAKGGVSFTFTVDNVTESSHTYDPASNVVNSATF